MRKYSAHRFSIILNILLILFLIGYFLVPFVSIGILAKTFLPICYLIDRFQGDLYLPPWCEDVLIPPFFAGNANVNQNINANKNVNANIGNINTNTNNDLGIANPAAVRCINDGGATEAYKTAGGEAAICIFKDNSICEEWAYFRGECKVGQCQKVCQKAGTADEGWYNSCTNELLKLEKCSVAQKNPTVTAANIEISNPAPKLTGLDLLYFSVAKIMASAASST